MDRLLQVQASMRMVAEGRRRPTRAAALSGAQDQGCALEGGHIEISQRSIATTLPVLDLAVPIVLTKPARR